MISISSSCSPVAAPSPKASATPIKTGIPAPPPWARKPFRPLRSFRVPTEVNTCGSKSSTRRSSSVIPSEFRSSSSNVRLRADLLDAPPLCVDDMLPLRRAGRGAPPPVAAAAVTVVVVAGLRSFRGRAATAARGESGTALASGSSSSSTDSTRGRTAFRNGGRALRGEGSAGSGDRGGRFSNTLCTDIPRLRRGGVGGRGTGVTLSGSESGGGGAGSASSVSSCPWTTIAGT